VPASGDPQAKRRQAGALRRVAGLPALERPADPLGLEREGFADVLEREWPAHVVRGEPLGRFSEQASATCASGAGAATKGPNRLFEHCRHELVLRRPFGWTLQELRELHGKEMVRNELARIVRLFDSYTERRAPHVVPVSSKVDASAFRQVHAIVTRMRTTAGRRC